MIFKSDVSSSDEEQMKKKRSCKSWWICWTETVAASGNFVCVETCQTVRILFSRFTGENQAVDCVERQSLIGKICTRQVRNSWNIHLGLKKTNKSFNVQTPLISRVCDITLLVWKFAPAASSSKRNIYSFVSSGAKVVCLAPGVGGHRSTTDASKDAADPQLFVAPDRLDKLLIGTRNQVSCLHYV